MLATQCEMCGSAGPRHAAGSTCDVCEIGTVVGTVRDDTLMSVMEAVAPARVRPCDRCNRPAKHKVIVELSNTVLRFCEEHNAEWLRG